MTYLKDIVYTAFICGIITAISSISKKGTMKYVKFVCAIVFLTSIIAPFINQTTDEIKFLDDLYGISSDNASDNVSIYDKSALGIIEDEICNIVKKDAAETFGCDISDFKIEMNIEETENGELSIIESRVYVSGEARFNTEEKIKKHFDKMLNCDTEVIITE